MLWQRILQQEFIELPDLFAAERKHVDQRQKLLDVKRVCLAQPEVCINLFLLILFDNNLFVIIYILNLILSKHLISLVFLCVHLRILI